MKNITKQIDGQTYMPWMVIVKNGISYLIWQNKYLRGKIRVEYLRILTKETIKEALPHTSIKDYTDSRISKSLKDLIDEAEFIIYSMRDSPTIIETSSFVRQYPVTENESAAPDFISNNVRMKIECADRSFIVDKPKSSEIIDWREISKQLHYALTEASIPKSVEAQMFIRPAVDLYNEKLKKQSGTR